MRSVRFLLAFFIVGLAASGSILIGWIYAGTHRRVATGTPNIATKGVGTTEVPTPTTVTGSGAISGSGIQSSRAQPIPDLGKIEILPGASLSSSGTDQINGFPTVSRDVLRRAAGKGGSSDLPEIKVPLPGQRSGSFGTEGFSSGQLRGGGRP